MPTRVPERAITRESLPCGPVGCAICLDTAHPCTCLALELLAPAACSQEYTCLPGYKEAKQLQVHVHSNMQEGVILDEGVFIKVGEEAEGKTTCQLTLRPPRDKCRQHRKLRTGHLSHLEGDPWWSGKAPCV